METSALGAIETFGLVPAIEAADAAVKSADVILTGCQYAGAGLVTVMLSGDISAVKASVEAGEAAAKRLGSVISTTVIGRTAQGLDIILGEPKSSDLRPSDPGPSDPALSGFQELDGSDGQRATAAGPSREEAIAAEAEPVLLREAEKGAEPDTDPSEPAPSEKSLRKMKVTRLRALARSLGDTFSMERKKIKFARKQELIRAILAYYRQI